MKAIYKNIALAALTLSAVACTQEEDFAPSFLNDPDAVRITAQVASGNVTGGFTRSNPLGTTEEQAKFNDGDQIAVTADGQDAVTYTFNGTDTWTPEEGKYLKWEANSMNFTAWYPVGEGTDAQNFTPNYGQTASLQELQANDYMTFSENIQKNGNDNSVSIELERQMARIVISEISYGNQFNATTNAVESIAITAGSSKYTNGAWDDTNVTAQMYKHTDDDWYAVLPPTATAEPGQTFLTITLATDEILTVKGIPATEAGKSYDYTLTVGKDKATIGNVEVNPWTDGTAIPGGEAVEEEKEIPYVTFRAASEQTLDLEQTKSQKLDEWGNSVYEDDEETIPVLVPNPYPGYDGDTGCIEYSVGNSNEWTKFEPGSQPVAFGGDKGDLHLRGISPKGTLKAQIVFGNATSVACSGDIRTLVDWENYETADTKSAIFYGLFENCTVLTSAPELPATTLAASCYISMFYGCTSLTAAPELPATSLAESCYVQMFAGCTNLAAAPELSATNLANDCYNGMFVSCTSLTSAPELPATSLANDCYNGMFNYCINLASAPELPAENLVTGCYAGMFMNCTSLTSAPELPAKTLVAGCYYQMFSGCTSLNSVTMLATDISASNCLTNWLEGVAATGTFTKAAGMESLPTGVSGIPSGWTVQNYVAPGEEN